MKPSLAEYAFAYVGCALMMAAVFHKPLGLPTYSDSVLILASLLCLFFFVRLQRRRKSQPCNESSDAHPRNKLQTLWENRSGRFWIIVVIFAINSIGFAFVGPYTVEHLSPSQAVVSSIITFIVGVALAFFVFRRKQT